MRKALETLKNVEARPVLIQRLMAYVITRACVGVCDTGCVDVCPCDCIHGVVPVEALRKSAPNERARSFPGVQMFIDPEGCIDCGACLPECPADAIVSGDMVPPGSDDAERNARFFSPQVTA